MDNNINIIDSLSLEEIMEVKDNIENKLKFYWGEIILELFKSIGWIAGGAIATFATYIISYGMITFVFYGAIIYGMIRLFKILHLIYQIHKEIKLNRKMLWASLGCFDFEKYY